MFVWYRHQQMFVSVKIMMIPNNHSDMSVQIITTVRVDHIVSVKV